MEKKKGHTSEIPEEERVDIIRKSTVTIGRAIFMSILITLISFAPILFLTGQEKKLFTPLVLTKTFCMIGSAITALFILPAVLRSFVKGTIRSENNNPVSKYLTMIFSPIVRFCLQWKKSVITTIILFSIASIPVVMNTGTEFMPPLDEGSLLMMPVTLPDVSNSEAKRILQVQDKILKNIPEVENVLGKAGRAYTATDNAPMSMIETIIILKPKAQWREGMTREKLISEIDEKVKIPGVMVGWTQPIINRINMLSTGIRTDVGVKIYGQNLDTIFYLSGKIEKSLRGIEGLSDLYLEQLIGGKYLTIKIDRDAIARYGISVEDVNMVIESALGGMNLTNTVEGRERFTISVRLAQDFRNDISEIKRTPVQTSTYGNIPLSSVADISVADGPPMINSENAMLRGTVLFNIRGRDMGSVVKEAKNKIENEFKKLPKGYFIQWSGQYENQVRAQKRLSIIIPIVLLIMMVVLYTTFHSFREVLIIFSGIPIAFIGGILSLHFYHVNFSVAVAVGFISLLGVAVETGVLILFYMNNELRKLNENSLLEKFSITPLRIEEAIFKGSALRIRPILMTVIVDVLGMIPVIYATGAGSDVMRPIALPFVFGLLFSTLYSLILIPCVFALVKEYEFKKKGELTFIKTE
ncbi:MAG: efflux RND transporter permease subunit [Bacteroidetes bacterium]|nr:MAG: efflux RND transporter permease subunit [Bacteroidota bacterium]